MNSFLFRVLDTVSVFAARKELTDAGLHDLYIIEDDATGETLIGGLADSIAIDTLQTCELADRKAVVSWENQWSQFAADFHDGKAHILLEPFGVSKTLLLEPGPGFGDLSHPTTYLMLDLMKGCVKDEIVLDLGCGSGILSLAAVMMGATAAYGIDIDPLAVEHARKNALVNHLKSKTQFTQSLPLLPTAPVVLINMILPEQRNLLREYPELPQQSKLWITSGILASQKKEAFDWFESLGLHCIQKKQRGEWIGCKLYRT